MIFSLAAAGQGRNARQLALGTAIAEAGYAFLAFIGFSTLLAQYEFIVPVSRGLGAVLLTTLGILFILKPPSEKRNPKEIQKTKKTRGSFYLGFSITALNPTLIATWTTVMALLHSMDLIEYTPEKGVLFSIGVATGIAAWFYLFIKILKIYRKKISENLLKRIIQLIGLILIGIGIWFAIAFFNYVWQ